MQTKTDELLHMPLIVVNLGVRMFADALEGQDVEVVQVDWIPPAGGDKEMQALLDRLL